MIAQLQDIIPALTSFFLGLIVLVYFLHKENPLSIIVSVYFLLREKPFGIIISSISFILLPFIFQIISVNVNNINSFLKTYKNILNFPLVTILATTASIFLGNTLIRYFTDRKEKTEFAVLFINGIESHIDILEQVFPEINLPSTRTKDRIVTEGREYIEIYKSNLIEDKSYDIAFNKIGIFNEYEIDLVSRYNEHLKKFLLFIDIFCCTMSGDTETYHEKMGKVKYKDITKTEDSNLTLSFKNIQILTPITKTLGYLCIYHLSLKYSQQYSAKYREEFLKECGDILRLFWNPDLFPKYEFDGIIFPNIKIEFHI